MDEEKFEQWLTSIVGGAECSQIKYVRFIKDGIQGFHFCNSDLIHKDQVVKGEQPLSAGFIKFSNSGRFRITNQRSESLDLGPDFDVDGPAIAAISGMEYLGSFIK